MTELTRAAAENRLRCSANQGWRVLATNLALALVALVVASLVIFFALHYLPGDLAAIIGGTDASAEQLEQIREDLGLNRSVWAQYVDWFGAVLTGDFGTSPLSGKSVGSELGMKLRVTGPLSVGALILSTVLAVPLGMVAAVRAETWPGRLLSWFTQLGIAIPTFIVGIVLVVFIALPTGWFPATGFPRSGWSDPGAASRSLVLPVITLAIPLAAGLLRFVRSAVLDTLGQDYLRTALAQGLRPTAALIGHGMRNASLPLVSVIALEAAALLTGTVIVEQVFALPGVGSMILSAVSTRDVVTVQSTLMMLSAAVIALMVVTNLISQLLDPRVRRQ